MRTPHPPAGGDAIPSVSSLTYRLKGVVEGAFSKVQVEGELSNVKASARGHVWFTLRDPGAELSAVIWASTARRISAELRDGKKMIASGDIEIYPPHGRYRLIVRSIRDAGLGNRRSRVVRMSRKASPVSEVTTPMRRGKRGSSRLRSGSKRPSCARRSRSA